MPEKAPARKTIEETLEYAIECDYVQHAAVEWLRDRVSRLCVDYDAQAQFITELLDYLDYCGWGDSWQRAVSEHLRTQADIWRKENK